MLPGGTAGFAGALAGAGAPVAGSLAGLSAVPLQVDPLQRVLEGYLGPELSGTVARATVFVAVVLAFWLLDRTFVSPLFDRLLKGSEMEEHARRPLGKIVTAVVLFVGLSVAFGLAGYGSFLQSLATIAAAATLAVGFALQDVIRNFVAGVFIFTDKPFKIGDWIVWNDNSGIVEDVSFRVTRVRTFDNELLTVPNSNLTEGVIKNPVAKDTLRLTFVFGIDYDDDIEAATEFMLEEAREHPEILDDPEPTVRLTELADSSVGLQARVWIDDPSRADFLRTRTEYATAVKNRLDEEGITIPFPQRTVSGRDGSPPSAAFADR